MKVIYFSNSSKFHVHFENAILTVMKIIAFELVPAVSVN